MERAFTFIEIMVVVIIIAILAIVVIPRMVNVSEMRLEMAAHKLAADLKYAREFAMNHNCRSRVVFAPDTSTYTVSENSSGSWQAAKDPATRDDLIVTLNQGNYAGVSIVSANFDGDTLVEFDSLGTPYSSGGGTLGSTGSVLLSCTGGAQKTINVTPVTGRVSI